MSCLCRFDDCLDDEKDAEFLLPLAVVLKTNRYLKVLKLENCNLSDKDIAKLYEPLRKTTALESFRWAFTCFITLET